MAEAFVVDVPGWRKLQWLRHGFSVRRGGVSTVYGGRSLNVGWTKEDDPANVAENRRFLVEKAGGPAMKLVTIRQVHGNRIWPVAGEEARARRLETHDGKAVLEGDGLVTDAPGVLLAAGTADCVPVLLVDPVRRAVGAFHAGWRGTAARIVEQGVAAMRKEYGSRPEDLLAAVGPSIGACCYTVGEEVREKFSTEFSYGEELLSKVLGEDGSAQLRIDLWEANRRQLLVAGVAPNAISLIGECTGCKLEEDGGRRYFSHRMEEGRTGRMLNVIGISAEGAGV